MLDKRDYQARSHTTTSVFRSNVHAPEFNATAPILPGNVPDRHMIPPGKPNAAGSSQINLVHSMVISLVWAAQIGWAGVWVDLNACFSQLMCPELPKGGPVLGFVGLDGNSGHVERSIELAMLIASSMMTGTSGAVTVTAERRSVAVSKGQIGKASVSS